jgi:methylmalonyl-CoA mutase C-terminal domain/subunit
MSLLNGAHLVLFSRVARLLREKGINDILLVGGGIIPEQDKKLLEKEGVMGNFGPGTPLADIIKYISNNIIRKR